jgi:hypothetical protein
LKSAGRATYGERVNANEREEISASVAAHAELGPRYDAAVAEGLVERIGEEIDRRIDERLHGGQPTAPRGPVRAAMAAALPPEPAPAPAPGGVPRRSVGVTGMILGLGSMGLAVGATSVVVSHHVNAGAEVLMVLLIWLAIVAINVAHAQRRF